MLNLFNQEAATSKYSTYQKVDGVNFDEADFYAGRLDFAQLITEQNVAVDPRFLQEQLLPGADRRALRGEVPVLARIAGSRVLVSSAPRADGPRGFFLGDAEVAHAQEYGACVVALALFLLSPALAQQPLGPKPNVERARVHYMQRLGTHARGSVRCRGQRIRRRRSSSIRSTPWRTTASDAHTWRCTATQDAIRALDACRTLLQCRSQQGRSTVSWTPTVSGRIA